MRKLPVFWGALIVVVGMLTFFIWLAIFGGHGKARASVPPGQASPQPPPTPPTLPHPQGAIVDWWLTDSNGDFQAIVICTGEYGGVIHGVGWSSPVTNATRFCDKSGAVTTTTTTIGK